MDLVLTPIPRQGGHDARLSQARRLPIVRPPPPLQPACRGPHPRPRLRLRLPGNGNPGVPPAAVAAGDRPLRTPGGRPTHPRGRGEMTAVLDTLGQAVDRFCAQLSREGYMVDRERAGDLHLILVRDWDGEFVGR